VHAGIAGQDHAAGDGAITINQAAVGDLETEILGPDAPQHLTMAGQLRMAHRQASLRSPASLPARR